MDSDLLRLDFGDYEDRLVEVVIENHIEICEKVMENIAKITKYKQRTYKDIFDNYL